MATLEDEIRNLKENNNELVQKVQFWKVAAANKENEKLELMKEINELRLQLSRIRSGGAAQARKLETALQSTSKEALTHLVKASNAVARTIELTKTYMQDRQDMDNASSRWSTIGGTPNSDRVHRVPPMLIGGQSIQPVVSLSRTLLNTSSNSHSRTIVMSRSPNQNRNVTERAVPVHMLQDVYIPLTRINVAEITGNNIETETESNDLDNSAQDLGLDDSGERSLEDSQNMSEGDDFETSRRLEAVEEDLEPEDEDETPPRSRTDNPLEGPSWLLDGPSNSRSSPRSSKSKSALEPDSTTRDETADTPPLDLPMAEDEPSLSAPAFSPTVRRRKRTSSPRAATAMSPGTRGDYSPRPVAARRNSNSGRVLKVLVAKMRLDSDSDSDSTPPKRPALTDNIRLSGDMSPTQLLLGFDAPSPNGATDARVIVLEQMLNSQSERGSGEPTLVARRDSRLSQDSRKPKPHSRDMSFGDCHPHTKDGQNRLASDRSLGEHSRVRNKEEEIMVVTYRGGRISETNVDNSEMAVTHKRPKIGESRRDEERTGVSNRDGSRLGSVGDSALGSMGGVTSRVGSVGPDGRDSDSSIEQAREGRTRRSRKLDLVDASHRGPKIGESRRDEEPTGVLNRDESRLESVGDSALGSVVNITGRTGSAGPDGRDSDSSTEQVKGNRTRRLRKLDLVDASHRGPKIGGSRRDEEPTGVSNRDESRLGSVGDSALGSVGDVTGRTGSAGPDGRDSDSSTEQAREGRSRRPRKRVVYKEKPLNRKMRR